MCVEDFQKDPRWWWEKRENSAKCQSESAVGFRRRDTTRLAVAARIVHLDCAAKQPGYAAAQWLTAGQTENGRLRVKH